MQTHAGQLSLFDDFVVALPPPAANPPSARGDRTAVAANHPAASAGPNRPHAQGTTIPSASTTPHANPVPPQTKRIVEPNLTAKLRVTIAVYRQFSHLATHVLQQLEAMVPEIEALSPIMSDDVATTIAKSAFESPILHAAIQLQACVLAPMVITETPVSAEPEMSDGARAAAITLPRAIPPGMAGIKTPSSSPVPPGQHLPMVPYVLAVAEQQNAYHLPHIERFTTVYITPERIRIRNAKGAETNRKHVDLWCLTNDAHFSEATAHYHNFQLALDALAMRYRTYGNYRATLHAAGGVAMHPGPLCPMVIRLEDPDKVTHTAPRWRVPSIARFDIKKHTDTTLESPTSGLGDSSLYMVCASRDDADALEADHRAAGEASTAWLRFLQACGTVRQAATDRRYGAPWDTKHRSLFDGLIAEAQPAAGTNTTRAMEERNLDNEDDAGDSA